MIVVFKKALLVRLQHHTTYWSATVISEDGKLLEETGRK